MSRGLVMMEAAQPEIDEFNIDSQKEGLDEDKVFKFS
jgi:hypothetical protein